jgi:hypothetical protein
VTWLGVLLALAITLRLTRLITADVIAQPLRTWIVEHRGADSHSAVFIHCPWCVGWWFAISTSLACHWLDDAWGWQVFATACAVSWVTAMAQMWMDET